jgi:hypothetical protein
MRVLLGVTGLVAIAIGLGPASAEDMKLACARDNAVRTVAVVDQPASGSACEVQYEKTSLGEPAQVLWRADNDQSFCSKQAKALVERLGEAGWTCDESAGVAAATQPEEPLPTPFAAAVEVAKPEPQGLTAALPKNARPMAGAASDGSGDRPAIDPDSSAGLARAPGASGPGLRPTIH